MMAKKNFPIRIPRSVSGIRAQDLRGVGTWWGNRWLERLESMGLGSRLGRGKAYALSGQVIALTISGETVNASVVGTRQNAYDVKIIFRTPDAHARARIIKKLKAEPMLVALLLANYLSLEVEEIFRAEGFSLFPLGQLGILPNGKREYDMTTNCNCPDYANPCKHTSAVLLILSEEIARRPLTLLEFRGISIEDLVDEK